MSDKIMSNRLNITSNKEQNIITKDYKNLNSRQDQKTETNDKAVNV